MSGVNRILAEGTVFATRQGSLEQATDYIIRHDSIIERHARASALIELQRQIEDKNMTMDEMQCYIEGELDALVNESLKHLAGVI